MKVWIAAAALIAAMPASASAADFQVSAQDNIYGAGQASAPGGGNVPTAVVKLGSSAVCFTIAKVSGSLPCSARKGCIEVNNGDGDTPNDADGVGAAPDTSSNTGTALISGITAPHAGYLVGVFTTAHGPQGAAPSPLDFTNGEGTAFTSLSPELDQTFFIGDGLTGDHKGIVQKFMIPPGAARLRLGISDAPGYNGSPGAYDDNVGTFHVSLQVHKNSCS